MFPASFLLAILLLSTPALIVFDGAIIRGSVAAAAAVMLAIVALRIRPGEVGPLQTVVRRPAIVAVVLALWMLAQVLPLQSFGLAHPIWKSAEDALGQSLAGSISIDPGLTLTSFIRFLSIIAIAFVATAVTVDRQRAELVLYALTAVTAAIALMLLALDFGGFKFLGAVNDAVPVGTAIDIAGLGVVLAAATALHTFERGKSRRPGQLNSVAWVWSAFVVSLVALGISFLALVVGATSQIHFAVACGVATLAVAIMIRRFGIGPWGISAIISATVFVAAATLILQPGIRTFGLSLAFADHAPAPQIAVTQRALSDNSWAGTGAGTFAAVLPIYRNTDEISTGPAAPTAAAAIAVEMGRPFLGVTFIATIALIAVLLRGAWRRQRDSIYPIVGASCVVVIMLLAIGNVAVLNTSVLIIAAIVIGAGMAQTESRSSMTV